MYAYNKGPILFQRHFLPICRANFSPPHEGEPEQVAEEEQNLAEGEHGGADRKAHPAAHLG